MRRTGLGRHGGLDTGAGDPLDGLVNLFDIGIVLAVAFLLAGLGLTRDADTPQTPSAAGTGGEVGPRETITVPERAPQAEGRGDAVGTVYRMPDGRLVLVRPDGPP